MLRTNGIKAKIIGEWICRERAETANHIASECSQLAQKELKNRFDKLGNIIHLQIKRKLKFSYSTVTLCRWSAKQTAGNQTKGFEPAISTWPEVVRGREKRVGQRTTRDDGQGQSTRDSREMSWHERGSRPVKEDRVKMSRHSSSFVEVSLESTLALVCTCTMLHNSPSALELTPSVCLFVLFFFSCSLDCIWCSGKEMCVPLSEPLVDHRQ